MYLVGVSEVLSAGHLTLLSFYFIFFRARISSLYTLKCDIYLYDFQQTRILRVLCSDTPRAELVDSQSDVGSEL